MTPKYTQCDLLATSWCNKKMKEREVGKEKTQRMDTEDAGAHLRSRWPSKQFLTVSSWKEEEHKIEILTLYMSLSLIRKTEFPETTSWQCLCEKIAQNISFDLNQLPDADKHQCPPPVWLGSSQMLDQTDKSHQIKAPLQVAVQANNAQNLLQRAFSLSCFESCFSNK